MLGLKISEIPSCEDWNCATTAAATAKIGKPQPKAEYGMNSISLETLKDPLKIWNTIIEMIKKLKQEITWRYDSNQNSTLSARKMKQPLRNKQYSLYVLCTVKYSLILVCVEN